MAGVVAAGMILVNLIDSLWNCYIFHGKKIEDGNAQSVGTGQQRVRQLPLRVRLFTALRLFLEGTGQIEVNPIRSHPRHAGHQRQGTTPTLDIHQLSGQGRGQLQHLSQRFREQGHQFLFAQ